MGDSDLDQLYKLFAALGRPSEDDLSLFPIDLSQIEFVKPDFHKLLCTTDDMLVDLVSRMLQYDPKKRLTLVEALTHPYFDTVHEIIRDRCWPVELGDLM
jgi:serine/threonine protein kinase